MSRMNTWMIGSMLAMAGMSLNAYSENSELLGVPKPLAMGLKHYSYADAAIEDTGADLSVEYTHLKLPVGKFEVLDHTLVPTLSLEQTAFDVKNDNGIADDPTLYTLKTQFMFVKKIDDKWMRVIQVTPSMHTDFEVQDEEAFSLMGLAIWNYTASETTSWTMGVGANRLFGEYKPIPLLSYQYRLSAQNQLDIGFPVTKWEYRWDHDWLGFAAIRPEGGNWRFEAQNGQRVNVSYSSWVASIGARYQVQPKIWASLEFGQGLNRKFDLDDSSDTGQLKVDNSNVIMFSLGLHP